MEDIDNVLGSKKYFNASADPVSAVAEAVGKSADAFKKPDIGKFVAQRCGRKGLGFVFNKSKRDAFEKCSKEATDDFNKQYTTTATTISSGGTDVNKSLTEQQLSNTNKILIGLGVVVVGLVTYIAIKK
jgi:hypothetical protein